MKKIKVPHVIVLINPSKPEPQQDLNGEIKLFTNQLEEFAHLNFSKVKKERRVYISGVNVDREYRKRGYGRLLVSIFESLVKSWGLKQIYLIVADDDAEKFWKKMGCVEEEDYMVKKIK
jgi:ribosomal protein S18 acetylase RimI-like enzyme